MATTTHPGNAPHTAYSAADAEHSKLIATRNRHSNSGRVPHGAHTTVRPHRVRFVPGISRPPGRVPEDYCGVEDSGVGVPLAVAAGAGFFFFAVFLAGVLSSTMIFLGGPAGEVVCAAIA
jgi:hypothetical protein